MSNMGLLNIGRSEGSQIIQLFGRGVRLRGRDMTLKRSAVIAGEHPDYITLLETLNIFAVRANYMVQFRDYLEREGVAPDGLLELPLFIEPNRDFLDKGLVIPNLDKRRNFVADTEVLLEPVPGVRRVLIDVSAKVSQLDSISADIAHAHFGVEGPIPPESLALVDWDRAYLDLLRHKEQKGLDNLVICPDAPRHILGAEQPVYHLIAEENVVKPRRYADRERLQETVVSILRKYADALYRHKREQGESNHLVYKTLDESDPNFQFNVSRENGVGRYIVSVSRSEGDLIREIEQLIADCRKLYDNDTGNLPRIYFDQHLYQPLLVESADADKVKLSPPGLNEGEKQFVNDLKEYWIQERDNALACAEVFLLRNQSRGTGIGFFENSGFYPDFILWIKAADEQRIVFIEPHGMHNANAYANDDKAQLHARLPELARGIAQRAGSSNICLDSFIISTTPYEELYKRYDDGSWDREQFAEVHVLFF